MRKGNLEDLLIENTIDNNPSILHKMMQLSTFSYIEKKRALDYADAEFTLYTYRRRMNYTPSEEERKIIKKEKWNADIVLVYRENGKSICEIIEVETIKADELLYHRKKNIMKKIKTVERAYNAKELNDIFKGVCEVRFSLSLNASHLTLNERYRVARNISKDIIQERNAKYKDEDVNLYNIYMLTDNIWDYCREGKDKNLLMNYNLAMSKKIWKEPLKRLLKRLYIDLDEQKVNSLYEVHYFER